MLDPTWGGVSDWLRYGFHGVQTDEQRNFVATPRPSPTPDDMRTIAVVRATDPGAYRIRNGGGAMCHDGSPGHKLLLQALRDPETHPLTSVVIDVRSLTFCTMDLRFGQSSALSFTGFFELHRAGVGPYREVIDGTADFFIRALGISAKRVRMAFAFSVIDPQ